MASLFDSLTIARSGVLTHQTRMAVISHNIANVNTPGYHRQKAVLTTNPSNEPNIYESRRYSVGTGVKIADVIRSFDQAREGQYLSMSASAGSNNVMADTLPGLEALMNSTVDGVSLTDHLNRFWAAWQDVATNPSNIAMRNVLLERAETLTDSMNSIASNLDDYNTQLVGGAGPYTGLIPDKVDEINRLATRIQALNARITVADAQNVSANDLMDERDLLTRELSNLAGITVDALDHSIRIDGQVLVSGDGVTRNDLALDSVGPLQFSVGGTPVTITAGELNGYVQTQDVATTLRSKLDTLAIELQTQINTAHTAGYDLNGDLGLDFFTGTDAGDISINSAMYNASNPLLNDPTLVAAAAVLDPGPPPRPNVGDGANALLIADLFGTRMVALGNQTFNEFFTNLTAGVGTAVEAVEGAATDDQTALDAYANAMQSTDGVNMDEELLDMMGAQRAFQAAARMVTTIDEMMDTVINQMKR